MDISINQFVIVVDVKRLNTYNSYHQNCSTKGGSYTSQPLIVCVWDGGGGVGYRGEEFCSIYHEQIEQINTTI